MSLDPAAVVAKVSAAKRELAAAEKELDRAIRDLRQRDRAQKEIIAPTLEAAFARLVAARTTLVELEDLVTEES